MCPLLAQAVPGMQLAQIPPYSEDGHTRFRQAQLEFLRQYGHVPSYLAYIESMLNDRRCLVTPKLRVFYLII